MEHTAHCRLQINSYESLPLSVIHGLCDWLGLNQLSFSECLSPYFPHHDALSTMKGHTANYNPMTSNFRLYFHERGIVGRSGGGRWKWSSDAVTRRRPLYSWSLLSNIWPHTSGMTFPGGRHSVYEDLKVYHVFFQSENSSHILHDWDFINS